MTRLREKVHTWPNIACCASCRRSPLMRHGREYLYRYEGQDRLVCSDRCAATGAAPAPMPTPPVKPYAVALLAKAYDDPAADASAKAEGGVLLRRARMRGAQAVAELMADTIVARTAGEGACTYHDLRAAGFTPDELRRLKPTALGLAARRVPDLRGEGAAA